MRLGVPLVLCSVVTYSFYWVLDTEMWMREVHDWRNLVVSCQLISPNVFNNLFGWNLEYVNGSYWFLWVEFQFLVIVSLIGLLNKEHFERNMGIAMTCIYVGWYIARRVVENYFLTNKFGITFSEDVMLMAKNWIWTLNLPVYAVYLMFGMVCAGLYHREWKKVFWLVPMVVLPFVLEKHYCFSVENEIVWGIMLMWIVYAFANGGSWGRNMKFFVRLGESSYVAYLLHEYIGVLVIHKFAFLFGKVMWILPILLIVVMAGVSYLSCNYIEKPLMKYILKND